MHQSSLFLFCFVLFFAKDHHSPHKEKVRVKSDKPDHSLSSFQNPTLNKAETGKHKLFQRYRKVHVMT